ncbi:hypothetical protein [Nakamurella leprariae]|uniref:Uncharacterized protein n=1 Tax=Nakamurella leprariae TaxID=2803911 RepID=A0A938YCP8_9ACTN|nr:hypothetical protein [Nakamurella leprariae]MBM9466057.1 hypothetical protein [Nakamurella leprariae]
MDAERSHAQGTTAPSSDAARASAASQWEEADRIAEDLYGPVPTDAHEHQWVTSSLCVRCILCDAMVPTVPTGGQVVTLPGPGGW